MHLGIIGGMGTEAGLATAQIICDAFRANDLPYPKLTLISDESIPDRSAFILKKNNQNPASKISQIGNQLLSLGVDHIIIACFTAHSPIIINQIDLKMKKNLFSIFEPLHLLLNNYKKVGVLATTGSQKSRVFENNLPNNEIIYPQADEQDILMQSIYKIKIIGINQNLIDAINQIAFRIAERSDIVVIGCTELLLIKYCQKLKIFNPIYFLGDQLAKMSLISINNHLTLPPRIGL